MYIESVTAKCVGRHERVSYACRKCCIKPYSLIALHFTLVVFDTVVLEVCSIVSFSKHNKMSFSLSALQRSGL